MSQDLEAAALRLLDGHQSTDDAVLCIAHFLNYWRPRDDVQSPVNPLVGEWIEQALSDLIIGYEANESFGLKIRGGRPQNRDKLLAVNAYMKYQERLLRSSPEARKATLAYFEFSDERNLIRNYLSKLSDADKLILSGLGDEELLALSYSPVPGDK